MPKPIPYFAIEAIINALQPALDAKNAPDKEKDIFSKKNSIVKNKKFATKLSILERKRLTALYDVFYEYGIASLKLLSERLAFDKSRHLKEQKPKFLFRFKAVPNETKSEKIKRILKNIGVALLFLNLSFSVIKMMGGPDIRKMLYQKIRNAFIKKDSNIQDKELQSMFGADMIEDIKKSLFEKISNSFLWEVYNIFNENIVNMLYYFFATEEIAKVYKNQEDIDEAIEAARVWFCSADEELLKNKDELENYAKTFLIVYKKLKDLIEETKYRNIPDQKFADEKENTVYKQLAFNINKIKESYPTNYEDIKDNVNLGENFKKYKTENEIFMLLTKLTRKNNSKTIKNNNISGNIDFSQKEIEEIIKNNTEFIKRNIENSDNKNVKNIIKNIQQLSRKKIEESENASPNFFKIPKVKFDKEKTLLTIFKVNDISKVDYEKLDLMYKLPDYDEFIKSFKSSYSKFNNSILPSNNEVKIKNIKKEHNINTVEIPIIVKSIEIDIKSIISQSIEVIKDRHSNNVIIEKNISDIIEKIEKLDKKERENDNLVRENVKN